MFVCHQRQQRLRHGSLLRGKLRWDLQRLPPVRADFGQLRPAIANIVINACDAMPKGGWLTIVTRSEAGAASVEVGDTGSGIPAEQLSRIYDPFFTTKEIGKGTGLGLSITYGIVQEHGGTITCDSATKPSWAFPVSTNW